MRVLLHVYVRASAPLRERACKYLRARACVHMFGRRSRPQSEGTDERLGVTTHVGAGEQEFPTVYKKSPSTESLLSHSFPRRPRGRMR